MRRVALLTGLIGSLLTVSAAYGDTVQLGLPTKGVHGGLYSLSMTSPTSGWAVGKNPASRGPIVKRWNGVSWHFTPVPHPSHGDVTLYGVDSSTRSNAWAVGDIEWDSGSTSAEILHWDGLSWQHSAAHLDDVLLVSVAAISATDVWASGYDYAHGHPMTVHWDGTRWSSITLPAGLDGADIELNVMTAISSNDVWVAGTNQAGNPQSVFGHWDGTAWRIVPSPRGHGRLSSHAIFGLSGTATDDVWASGVAIDPNRIHNEGLIEHWDGTRWTVVPSVQRGRQSRLNSISARTTGDVWAVGYSTRLNMTHAFTEHWDGKTWTEAATPPNPRPVTLEDVASTASADAWTVGSASTRAAGQVILNWNGAQWTPSHP